MKYKKLSLLLTESIGRINNLYNNNPVFSACHDKMPRTTDGRPCFGHDHEKIKFGRKLLTLYNNTPRCKHKDLINPNLIAELTVLVNLLETRVKNQVNPVF